MPRDADGHAVLSIEELEEIAKGEQPAWEWQTKAIANEALRSRTRTSKPPRSSWSEFLGGIYCYRNQVFSDKGWRKVGDHDYARVGFESVWVSDPDFEHLFKMRMYCYVEDLIQGVDPMPDETKDPQPSIIADVEKAALVIMNIAGQCIKLPPPMPPMYRLAATSPEKCYEEGWRDACRAVLEVARDAFEKLPE